MLTQMRELDLSTMEWRRVDAKGQPPPFRLHSSAAVLADKWIIHGGRRAGKFNVTNDTFVFDFDTLRQAEAAPNGHLRGHYVNTFRQVGLLLPIAYQQNASGPDQMSSRASAPACLNRQVPQTGATTKGTCLRRDAGSCIRDS